jgi:hypothetical protein
MARQTRTTTADRGSKARNVLLWITQWALAALFLFAAYAKLSMPIDEQAAQMGLPATFILFIAAAEGLGALGLVFPGLLRIQRRLTPLAASGLVVIMAGAVTITIPLMGVAPALVPFVVGVLAASVAVGRKSWWTPVSRHASPRLAQAH